MLDILTLEAYVAQEYFREDNHEIYFEPGVDSPKLVDYMLDHGHKIVWFLCAQNVIEIDEASNTALHSILEDDLTMRGYDYHHAVRRNRDSEEETHGFFVWDLTEEEAKDMASSYGQHVLPFYPYHGKGSYIGVSKKYKDFRHP